MANNAPLSTITLLMTRPQDAAMQFVDQMPDDIGLRVTPIYSPLLEINAKPGSVQLSPREAAIFSSQNGVANSPLGKDRIAYCVGAKTTSLARMRGWNAVMAGKDADDLVAFLVQRSCETPMVHLRGDHTRGNIALRLRDVGHTIREEIVYDQILRTLTQEAFEVLRGSNPVIIPLFSPRTAAQFARVVQYSKVMRLIALSQAVKQAAGSFGVWSVCDKPDAASMYSAIRHVISSG